MKKKKIYFWLILGLSLALRLYRLNSLELFGDELDVGYHAFSLLKTGRDYMGQFLPAYIRSFSESRAPLSMYATIPFIGLFGLNSWGVRMGPVLFGVLSIGLLYWLVKLLSKNEKVALISALVLALSPWHFHYSRAAFEVTLLLSLVLLGTIGFLKKKWWLTSLAFALSLYTYNTANIFFPLWTLLLAWTSRLELKKVTRGMVFSGLIFIFLALPLGLRITQGQASDRFNLISIFSNPKTTDQIVFKRNNGLGPETERIFHNKLTGWGGEFVNNYFQSFSPEFLFLKGDPNPRHSLPDWGQFYWWLLPFFLIGVYDLLKSKNKEFKNLTFGWLLLSPLASCLTVAGGNQATRLFLMLPPLATIIALGITRMAKRIGVLFLILAALFTSLFFYLHNYFVHYPQEHYRYWHYGYQSAMGWLAKNEDDFDRVMINNSYEPGLLRYLFWTKKDPAVFQALFEDDQVRENALPYFSGFTFGEKIYFGGITQEDKLAWLYDNLAPGDLYLAIQGDEVPGDWNWEKDPPGGLRVWYRIDTPQEQPLMYWVGKEE